MVALAILAVSATDFVEDVGLLGFLVVPAPLVITAVIAAIYTFVFGFFGKDVRYRIVLSTLLHATWPIFVTSRVLWLFLSWTSLAVPLPADGVLLVLLEKISPLEVWSIILTGMGFTLALGLSRRFAFSVVLAAWGLRLAIGLLLFLLMSQISPPDAVVGPGC